MIRCNCCNKTLKVKGKNLRLCKSCGNPMCRNCTIKENCKECAINEQSKQLVDEYFKDKYAGDMNEKETNIPSLVVNGDLNDLRCLSDEQFITNIEAFIEQLEEKKDT